MKRITLLLLMTSSILFSGIVKGFPVDPSNFLGKHYDDVHKKEENFSKSYHERMKRQQLFGVKSRYSFSYQVKSSKTIGVTFTWKKKNEGIYKDLIKGITESIGVPKKTKKELISKTKFTLWEKDKVFYKLQCDYENKVKLEVYVDRL